MLSADQMYTGERLYPACRQLHLRVLPVLRVLQEGNHLLEHFLESVRILTAEPQHETGKEGLNVNRLPGVLTFCASTIMEDSIFFPVSARNILVDPSRKMSWRKK